MAEIGTLLIHVKSKKAQINRGAMTKQIIQPINIYRGHFTSRFERYKVIAKLNKNVAYLFGRKFNGKGRYS